MTDLLANITDTGTATDNGVVDRLSGRRELAALTSFFVALTLLFTYPIWTAPATYLSELADVRLIAWTLAWDAHALVTDPAGLFDANIFYPNSGTLAYSEAFLGAALIVAPLNWLGFPVLAYNVVMLSAFVLSGVGATLWVRHLTGSLAAGVLAGVVWAFAPSKFDQLSHLHMLVGQWIPFSLWYCGRWVASGRASYLYATAAFAGLQFTFSMHYGLFLVPVLSLYTVALLALWRDAPLLSNPVKGVKQLAIAGVVFATLTLPVVLPYTMSAGRGVPERQYAEMLYYSAKPYSFIAGSPFNVTPHVRSLYTVYQSVEANYFIGTLPLLLALVAFCVLLPVALWRASWTTTGVTHGAGSRSIRGGSWRHARRWTFRSSAALAVIMTALHVGGFLAARQGRGTGWADLVIDVCQSVSPAVWLAAAVTVMLLSSPPGWRSMLRSINPAASSMSTVESPSGAPAATTDSRQPDIYLLAVCYVALMFYLLAYGPEVQGWRETLGRGPYALLNEWLFPFRSIRAVGRIGLVWVLFAAALAGYSLSRLLARLSARPVLRGAVLVVLACGVIWEYRTWPLPYAEADPAADPIYDWLAEKPGDFAVVHAPVEPGNQPWRETRYMLGSTRHWKRLVNGYSGFFPEDYNGLADAGLLTPGFFKLLRSDFPVRYLLVHDDYLANEEQHALLQRLLRRNRDVTFVEQVGHTYVFEVPRDRGTGSYVRRRYLAEQLRQAQGIQFLVRGLEVGRNESVIVLAGWGTETEVFEVGVDWEGARVEIPVGFHDELGGKPGYFEIRTHKLVPLGATGARIASGFTVDVQAEGASVGLNATLFYQTDRTGFQVHTLERFGTRISVTEEFPPTAAGAMAFRDYISSLPPNSVVAFTIATDEWRPLAAAAAEAIRMIGGDPPANEAISQMVVVGRKGASPGQALQHEHHKFAVIDIEVPSPSVELRGIGLY